MARRLGCAGAMVVVGLAVFGPPVDAQLPTLPLLTTAPSGPGATTTTLLPPLVSTPDLLPAPGSPTPGPSLLPLPTTAARRTVPYKPPPLPPSTPARQGPAPARASRALAATAIPADQVEGAELGQADPGFRADLPFAAQAAEVPTGDDAMELGIEESARERVGTLVSVMAGLFALVLFFLVVWLRRKVRKAPQLRPR